MCPDEEIGRNSESPCTIPTRIAFQISMPLIDIYQLNPRVNQLRLSVTHGNDHTLRVTFPVFHASVSVSFCSFPTPVSLRNDDRISRNAATQMQESATLNEGQCPPEEGKSLP